MKTIRIVDHVTFNQGVTSEEGQPIYGLIVNSFKKGESVELDFANVKFMTTAFLNVVIGALYRDYTSEQLKTILHLKNFTPETASRIKKVTDNAKAYYANIADFDKNVEEVLYESK